MYERWLAPYRHAKDLTMIEIGAKHGSSLNLWNAYFTNPRLILGLAYGDDADTAELKEDAKVTVHRGDQSKQETMQHLMSLGPWDVIIDDGSHVPRHVIFSLFALWKSIKPGGLYVIEDLETNYWPKGDTIYGYRLDGGIGAEANSSAVTKLEQVSRVLLRHGLGAAGMSVMPGDDALCSVEWGPNLVALRKCTEEQKGHIPTPTKEPLQGLQRWLEEATASNPQNVALPAAAPDNSIPTCTSSEDEIFACKLRELQSPEWTRRLYERDYGRWLSHFRSLPGVKVAELGKQVGLTMRLWDSYFDQPSELLGVQRDGKAPSASFMQFRSPAVSIYTGEDGNMDTLQHILSRGPWDVIVDDGSQPSHRRITCLFGLWRSLKPGGLYILESMGGDAWPSLSRQSAAKSITDTGNATAEEVSLVSKLEQIKQVLMRYEIGNAQMTVMPGDGDLCTMDWGMNIVALRKCTAENIQAGKHYRPEHFDRQLMAHWLSRATSTNPKL